MTHIHFLLRYQLSGMVILIFSKWHISISYYDIINRIVIQYGKRTTGSIHSGWTKVLGYINSFVIDIVIGNGYVSFTKD
jgi:hypothetical protein